MNVPDFGDPEMARYGYQLLIGSAGPPHSWGAVPDVWKLEATISENTDLWWGPGEGLDGVWLPGSVCNVEGCGVLACQLDRRGYRCEDHR